MCYFILDIVLKSDVNFKLYNIDITLIYFNSVKTGYSSHVTQPWTFTFALCQKEVDPDSCRGTGSRAALVSVRWRVITRDWHSLIAVTWPERTETTSRHQSRRKMATSGIARWSLHFLSASPSSRLEIIRVFSEKKETSRSQLDFLEIW